MTLVWIVYPALIYFGLEVLPPRAFGAVLLALLLWRYRRQAAELVAGGDGLQRAILVVLVLLAAGVVLADSESLLRLYPAAMNLGMLLLFGTSLARPPSMVERFARLRQPDLPAEAVRYTRRVTWVWCAFFVGNGLVAAWTALYASRADWALYNGLIAYLLMGALFGGEWLYRGFHMRGRT